MEGRGRGKCEGLCLVAEEEVLCAASADYRGSWRQACEHMKGCELSAHREAMFCGGKGASGNGDAAGTGQCVVWCYNVHES